MTLKNLRFNQHMTEYEAEEHGKRHAEDCPECDDYLDELKQ